MYINTMKFSTTAQQVGQTVSFNSFPWVVALLMVVKGYVET